MDQLKRRSEQRLTALTETLLNASRKRCRSVGHLQTYKLTFSTRHCGPFLSELPGNCTSAVRAWRVVTSIVLMRRRKNLFRILSAPVARDRKSTRLNSSHT